MLKAIFFDAAGTLIYLPRSVGEHYREVALRFGMTLAADDLNRAFCDAWARASPRANTHRPRLDDDKPWWRALVAEVFSQVLPDSETGNFDFDGYFEAVYAHFAEAGVWAAHAEVPEVFGELRARGIRLGMISNFDGRLRAVLDHLELTPFFERIIISSEVGADKPDPYIFEYALHTLQVAPVEALHVGDDPERDWGAEAVGMHVFRLKRPGSTLRGVLEMIDGGLATLP